MAVTNLLGLDVGNERVGVAMAYADVNVPVTVTTLQRSDPDFWDRLAALIKQYDIGAVVVGLPRGLNGQETAQTATVREFGRELNGFINLPIYWQDEALTSVKAEAELRSNSRQSYQKADIDALAACYILEDYIQIARVNA